MLFKVKEPKKIGGKRYIPTVAYELTAELKPTIILLQNMNQAKILEEKPVAETKKKKSNKDKVVTF